MHHRRINTRAWVPLLFVAASLLAAAGCAHTHATSGPGYQTQSGHHGIEAADEGVLVVAPDRGFLGNEEVRDAFQTWSGAYNAELVFVTDDRTKANLETALTKLRQRGARRAVLMPFFISGHHPRLDRVRQLLGLRSASTSSERVDVSMDVRMGRPFGESYFAVEILTDRLRAIGHTEGRRLIVVGFGASDEISHGRMLTDWQGVLRRAAEGFGFESVRVVIGHDPTAANHAQEAQRLTQALLSASSGSEKAIVVPFHLGKKLDGMMSFTSFLRRLLPTGTELVEGEVTPHPAIAMWMQREVNRYVPLRPEDTGVVFLAHGSDFHWNETMREAIASLHERYKIEFAFCMADPPIVERAVRRLEQRGARAIVIVRVFGMESSFRSTVERMIGTDIEREANIAAAAHAHGHHHGHGRPSRPRPRFRSSALMTTVGGLEAHELFAKALVARAREHSQSPAQETIILVAHGLGDDARNDHWLRTLESIANHMRQNGGGVFRAIRVGTWREDWPDKRETWVQNIRGMVQEARQNGGRAIVVPARTTGTGPERQFLDGLDFDLASGFAPHPLFARWVEEQIRSGITALQRQGDAVAQTNHPVTAAEAPVETPSNAGHHTHASSH